MCRVLHHWDTKQDIKLTKWFRNNVIKNEGEYDNRRLNVYLSYNRELFSFLYPVQSCDILLFLTSPLALETGRFNAAPEYKPFVVRARPNWKWSSLLFCCSIYKDRRDVRLLNRPPLLLTSFGWMMIKNLSCALGGEVLWYQSLFAKFEK